MKRGGRGKNKDNTRIKEERRRKGRGVKRWGGGSRDKE
jgi:hypothetical protein